MEGRREAIDLIVYATGFRISFPFIDREHLNWRDGRPDLYLNIFHPTRDNLFVAGMIQPDSGQWGLVDYQAQLIARFIAGLSKESSRAEKFRRRKSNDRPDLTGGVRYIRSPRHLLEVEHFGYRKTLMTWIRRLGTD